MKTLNKLISHLAIGILLLNFSCSSNQEIIPDEELDIAKAFTKFEAEYLPNSYQIDNWLSSTTSVANLEGESMTIPEELIAELFLPSMTLMSDLGFTQHDYDEMFGEENNDDFNSKIISSALILYYLREKYSNNPKSEIAGGPQAVDCFLEATGIAAGVALVGALTGQAGGKALRSAFKKAAKKIGSRVLGGVGLLFMAAEFAWCMSRD